MYSHIQVYNLYKLKYRPIGQKESYRWDQILKNPMAGYQRLKKKLSIKSDKKPIQQASLAEGKKRRGWIPPYNVGTILLMLKN